MTDCERSLDFNAEIQSPPPAIKYNPLIKRLLRNYQVSAERSLDGPHPFPGGGLCSPTERQDFYVGVRHPGPADRTSSRARASPTRMPPILIPMDRSAGDLCRRTETALEGKSISCFVVGGERRLCLPQVINTCLGRLTLAQIYGACDALQINCAPCNAAQLAALKRDAILPSRAPFCGLITLTDAQRLCNALLRGGASAAPPLDLVDRYAGIPVMHRCFGRCTGTLYPGVPGSTPSPAASAAVVFCDDCRLSFSVEQFVCHSHGRQETRTCHWGFEAANWRFYVQLAAPADLDDGRRQRLQQQLDGVKSGCCGRISPPRKRLESAPGYVGATSDQSDDSDEDQSSTEQQLPPATKRPRCVSDRQHEQRRTSTRSPSPPPTDRASSTSRPHHQVTSGSTVATPAEQRGPTRDVPVLSRVGCTSCRETVSSPVSLDRFNGQFVPNVSLVLKTVKAAQNDVDGRCPLPPPSGTPAAAAAGQDDRRGRRATDSVPAASLPGHFSSSAAADRAHQSGGQPPPASWRHDPVAVVKAAAGPSHQLPLQHPPPPLQQATGDRSAFAKPAFVVSVVGDLLDAELNLFKAALFGGPASSCRPADQSERFLAEFSVLQRRHVDVIRGVLQSHKDIQQELNTQRAELAVRLESTAAETDARRRQIEALQREDEAKVREARRENEQLRAELDAMVNGAKRSDIGLVKAKYKARAKHFQRKLELMEQANAHLIREMTMLRETLRHHQMAAAVAAAAAASTGGTTRGLPPPPTSMTLPLSPTSVGEASPNASTCVV